MFVTALTESPIPRPTHLSDVAELAFELRQCQVFHINSKMFDGVIGHGIVGKDIPIMARLAEARRWSKR